MPEIDPAIRQDIRKLETLEAYRALQHLDPVAAERLHAADTTRIQRALEVVRSTGRPLDHWQQHKVGGIGDEIKLHPLVMLPPRDWLYERCDRRLQEMLARGAIQEVERLVARNLPKNLPVMRAIGVAEFSDWLAGDIDRESAVERAQAATRQYAKRQYTWFRNQSPAEWQRTEQTLYNAIPDIIETILRP